MVPSSPIWSHGHWGLEDMGMVWIHFDPLHHRSVLQIDSEFVSRNLGSRKLLSEINFKNLFPEKLQCRESDPAH